jgi:hypothetical protein
VVETDENITPLIDTTVKAVAGHRLTRHIFHARRGEVTIVMPSRQARISSGNGHRFGVSRGIAASGQRIRHIRLSGSADSLTFDCGLKH